MKVRSVSLDKQSSDWSKLQNGLQRLRSKRVMVCGVKDAEDAQVFQSLREDFDCISLPETDSESVANYQRRLNPDVLVLAGTKLPDPEKAVHLIRCVMDAVAKGVLQRHQLPDEVPSPIS